MTENFAGLMKKKKTNKSRKYRVPNKMDPNRTIPRHITIKMAKLERQGENPKSPKSKAGSYRQGSSN